MLNQCFLLFIFFLSIYYTCLYCIFYQRLNLILIILMGVFQSRLAFLNLNTCVVWLYGYKIISCEIHVFGLYFQVQILCAREEFMPERKLDFCLWIMIFMNKKSSFNSHGWLFSGTKDCGLFTKDLPLTCYESRLPVV